MDLAEVAPPAILPLVADLKRWRLLAELARSDRRVGELTQLLGLPQNLVSYHLAELRKAGVVVSRRSSADGRDVYYRADLVRCQQLLAETAVGLHPGLRLAPVGIPLVQSSGPRLARVLFLCTGNSARSQMAEAILRDRVGQAFDVRSAGSHPKSIHPAAVKVMAERGIDISAARPKHLRRFARTRFDRVVTLCDKVREICPEFPGPSRLAHWSMADPSLAGDAPAVTAAFASTVAELDQRIGLLVAELTSAPLERTIP